MKYTGTLLAGKLKEAIQKDIMLTPGFIQNCEDLLKKEGKL